MPPVEDLAMARSIDLARAVVAIMALAVASLLVSRGNAVAADDAVLTSEFIYQSAPFPSCHASTIAETSGGLVAAWFGGLDEGDPSVGIWASRHAGGAWTPPVEVADGVSEDGK